RLYREVRESDRHKDEFVAMLAHELRNPLAPIRSGLDILALEGLESHPMIELMQQQIEHLVRLVDDLLDMSRILRGHVYLRRQPIELSDIVEQATEAFRLLIEAQHKTLQ